ncbi:outer membrane protein assembly factor BamE [Algicola sagamiensis]|uniref:outer membrane protein assembly factor BamE n=1 Tax=Algicola sagamiensis TaxID=163869 RepID=UPI000368C886|nr:outer membrane protein assembly factor BamE [Algicola sagamiensis]
MRTKFTYSIICLLALVLSGCSIYRISVPQGNFIEQKQVDKLRISMSKEQVKFVLGSPVAENAFREDVWYYTYHLSRGDDKLVEKNLTVYFENDQLKDFKGDFEKPADFNTPLE